MINPISLVILTEEKKEAIIQIISKINEIIKQVNQDSNLVTIGTFEECEFWRECGEYRVNKFWNEHGRGKKSAEEILVDMIHNTNDSKTLEDLGRIKKAFQELKSEIKRYEKLLDNVGRID